MCISIVFNVFNDKELKYRHRQLDLIVNPGIKDVFIKRAQIISSLRSYLDKNEFIEVETPVLQPIYGGASARPFTTCMSFNSRVLTTSVKKFVRFLFESNKVI